MEEESVVSKDGTAPFCEEHDTTCPGVFSKHGILLVNLYHVCDKLMCTPPHTRLAMGLIIFFTKLESSHIHINLAPFSLLIYYFT